MDTLDDPQHDETENLNACKEVDPPGGDVSEIHVVGLVLLGHEPDEDPVHQLHPSERGHSHVEEYSI